MFTYGHKRCFLTDFLCACVQSGRLLAFDMAPPARRKGKGDNARWTEPLDQIFLELFVEEMVAGNRPSHYFNTKGQENIEAKFNRETSLNWTERSFGTEYALQVSTVQRQDGRVVQ